MANPIPLEAPVIIAVRPVRSSEVIVVCLRLSVSRTQSITSLTGTCCTQSLLPCFGQARAWYAIRMLAKSHLIKPLVVAGAVATAIAAAPVVTADAVAAAGPAAATTAITFLATEQPGGSGCDSNGNCGSGGVNGGPGSGPGGQGCIPGVGCGSGHG